MGKTYKCEACGGTFEADWTEEEARAEQHQHFGTMPDSEMAQVCEDCFKAIMAANNHPIHWFQTGDAMTRNPPLRAMVLAVLLSILSSVIFQIAYRWLELPEGYAWIGSGILGIYIGRAVARSQNKRQPEVEDD